MMRRESRSTTVAPWSFIIQLWLMAAHVRGQACPQHCVCSPLASNTDLTVTCKGEDIVAITKQLPPDTVVFQYIATETFVQLGSTDFSHVSRLKALIIRDPGDHSLLTRKIAPVSGNVKLFHNLTLLQNLSININWEMNTVLPDLFKGLRHLENLDLSNTRLMNIDNLITSLQGLRDSLDLRVLNLWNIKTLEHSSSNLQLALDKLLKPLNESKLEELNIGYNAFRSVSPGLLQYAPKLKRIIVRNNVLIPILTSSLMTEVLLHPCLEEADFSEQGYRPATDGPISVNSYYTFHIPGMQSHLDLIILNDTHEQNDIVQQTFHSSKLQLESDNTIPIAVHHFLRNHDYLTCVIMLYNDTCNIFSQECNSTRQVLEDNHGLFCLLLSFFFRWHFTGIPCELIPSFEKLISPDCGACLVIPSSGNLRKMHISNLNIYDNVLLFGNYRDRPLCYYPNSSMEYLDMSLNVPHGYPELYKTLQADITGLNNMKILNCSYNSLSYIFWNLHENFPVLQTIDVSHNRLTLAREKLFLDMAVSLEVINLSHNVIKSVKVNTFSKLKKLKHLDLSSNMINEFNVSFSNNKALEYLDISNNKISSLPKFTMDQLNQIAMDSSHNVSINMLSNSLICTCATKDFVEWVLYQHPRNLSFIDLHNYVCTDRYLNRVNLQNISTWKLNRECYETLIYGCVGGLSTLVVALALLIFRKRFRLRHVWFNLTYKFERRNCQSQHTYDAFICFDDADSQWVDYKVKDQLQQFNIAYGEQAISPGQRVDDEAVNYMRGSHRIILVLSPAFIRSRKMYHAQLAEEHMINTGMDKVVVVILKSLNRVGLNDTLTNLMEHRKCLTWHENNYDAQNLFWSQLKRIIDSPCQMWYETPSETPAAPLLDPGEHPI